MTVSKSLRLCYEKMENVGVYCKSSLKPERQERSSDAHTFSFSSHSQPFLHGYEYLLFALTRTALFSAIVDWMNWTRKHAKGGSCTDRKSLRNRIGAQVTTTVFNHNDGCLGKTFGIFRRYRLDSGPMSVLLFL